MGTLIHPHRTHRTARNSLFTALCDNFHDRNPDALKPPFFRFCGGFHVNPQERRTRPGFFMREDKRRLTKKV